MGEGARLPEKAGDKAVDAFANQEALDYYGRAVEIGKRLGGEGVRAAARIAQKRGEVNFGIGAPDDAVGDFEEVRTCALGLGDRALEGSAIGWMGVMHSWGSDPEKGQACLREALEISKEGYTELAAASNFWLGSMLRIYGEIDESTAVRQRSRQPGTGTGGPDLHMASGPSCRE